MAVDVQVETVIARDVAVVAAYAGDPTNAPEWYANISSVHWRTEPPVRVDAEPPTTRMTLRNTGTPSGFGKVSAPLMAAAMKRATTKDLARLKALLEL